MGNFGGKESERDKPEVEEEEKTRSWERKRGEPPNWEHKWVRLLELELSFLPFFLKPTLKSSYIYIH